MSETVLTEQERITLNVLGDGCANHKAQMQAARIIDRLDAELVRLTNALPKTADGVAVAPGMKLYYLDGDEVFECFAASLDDCDEDMAVSEHYSTREAAEAAKGGQ